MKQYTSEQLLQQIHEYIGQLSYKRKPMGLYEPIEYVLGLGGKRLRPVLMLLAYNLYKDDVERIFPQAAGIETYHNFTLLHDDLMATNRLYTSDGTRTRPSFREMPC